MKKILITALISMFAIGTVSADYATDINNSVTQAPTVTSSVDFNSLPATAAGRSSDESFSQHQGGMQD